MSQIGKIYNILYAAAATPEVDVKPKTVGDSIQCCDFKVCRGNIPKRRFAKIPDLKYCNKCTRVCKEEKCGMKFTPEYAGWGAMDGFCKDCAECCGLNNWSGICEICYR